MKDLGASVLLFGLLFITGCTTYQPIAPGISPITLKAAETRPIGIDPLADVINVALKLILPSPHRDATVGFSPRT